MNTYAFTDSTTKRIPIQNSINLLYFCCWPSCIYGWQRGRCTFWSMVFVCCAIFLWDVKPIKCSQPQWLLWTEIIHLARHCAWQLQSYNSIKLWATPTKILAQMLLMRWQKSYIANTSYFPTSSVFLISSTRDSYENRYIYFFMATVQRNRRL